MRSAIIAVTTAALLTGIGCSHHNLNGCNSCGDDAVPAPAQVGRLPHHFEQPQGPAGPPSASYAYPYYTTRAPRDFLMDNPPSIGP